MPKRSPSRSSRRSSSNAAPRTKPIRSARPARSALARASGQRRLARVDRQHLARAAARHVHRPLALVAEHVERLAALARATRRWRRFTRWSRNSPVFCPPTRSTSSAKAVHLRRRTRSGTSPHHTSRRRGRPSSSRSGRIAHVHRAARREHLLERLPHLVEPRLHAERQHLHREVVAVAVHDQPGQLVGFAVHQAHRPLAGAGLLAERERALEALHEERGVDRVAAARQHARRDQAAPVVVRDARGTRRAGRRPRRVRRPATSPWISSTSLLKIHGWPPRTRRSSPRRSSSRRGGLAHRDSLSFGADAVRRRERRRRPGTRAPRPESRRAGASWNCRIRAPERAGDQLLVVVDQPVEAVFFPVERRPRRRSPRRSRSPRRRTRRHRVRRRRDRLLVVELPSSSIVFDFPSPKTSKLSSPSPFLRFMSPSGRTGVGEPSRPHAASRFTATGCTAPSRSRATLAESTRSIRTTLGGSMENRPARATCLAASRGGHVARRSGAQTARQAASPRSRARRVGPLDRRAARQRVLGRSRGGRRRRAGGGRRMAGLTGLEPATSCVTGRRSNQLNYNPATSPRGECPS